MSEYFDLGSYTREVSTKADQAKTWFVRGLLWCYGYNHEEAVVCFEKAVELDRNFAIAHWGIAYASGCNYNKPWEAFDDEDFQESVKKAHEHSQLALENINHASDVEADLIRALTKRYQNVAPSSVEEAQMWSNNYAEAMQSVYNKHQNDSDVATLYAEALMNLTPWELWDLRTGEVAKGAKTLEALEVLERSLSQPDGNNHPGLLHMYIHLMEMSPFPERALKACDALRSLCPDAGHLNHMPTHIDVLCGHYERVVSSNHDAIIADRKFLQERGALNFYSLYRCHNYHFKIYGAMFLGQYQTAIETADEMNSTLPVDLLKIESPPMADWLEGFVSVKQHVYIRFGKWHEIIEQDLPEDLQLYCVTTAMQHYAKAVAHAALDHVSQAEAEAELFELAYAKVPKSRYIFNNTCQDILAVARQMMLGEIAYRKGNFDEAFSHLGKSVELDDNLPYDEPWGWMQPTRHALGALLLEQNEIEEAARVYRADLGLDKTLARAVQHPDNIWSLQGYHECLTKMGREEEAALVKQRIDIAGGRTDVPVEISCYCRIGK